MYPQQEKPRHHQAAALARRRVLIVDDVSDSAHCLAMLLPSCGYDVRTASSASAAISICASFQPHIAMSDVEMPEMNGFALARSLRQTNGDALYLIAWTANDQAGVRAQAKQAGFNSFAVKPLDFSELRTLLDSVG